MIVLAAGKGTRFKRADQTPDEHKLAQGLGPYSVLGTTLRHAIASQLPVVVVASAPLAELARRLRGCRAFVGHDSGISHLAAALGLPCLVLWADTVEEVWRPQGDEVVILKESFGLRLLSVECVANELARMLPA